MRHVFRYLVDDDPAEGAQITLCDEDSRHLVKVVRRRVGDAVEVIAPGGDLWPCEVVSTDTPAVLRVTAPGRSAPPVVALALWVGLSEPGRLDLIAEKAAELGVRQLAVVVTDRARRVPDDDAWERRAARMQRVAISAARQSGRGVRPEPMGLVPFAHVLNMTIPGEGIILDPRAGDPLAHVIARRAPDAPMTLLVGGDTGFSDSEADAAVAAGFTAASLGPGILRAETAAIAAATLALTHLGGLS